MVKPIKPTSIPFSPLPPKKKITSPEFGIYLSPQNLSIFTSFSWCMNNVNYGFVYLIPYKNRIMLCKPLGWPFLLSALSKEGPSARVACLLELLGRCHSPPMTSTSSPGVHPCSCVHLPRIHPRASHEAHFILEGSCSPLGLLQNPSPKWLIWLPHQQDTESCYEPSMDSDLKSCHSDDCVFFF